MEKRRGSTQRNATRSNLEYTVTNQNEQNELQRDLQWKIAQFRELNKSSGVAEDKALKELELLTNLFGGDTNKAIDIYMRQHYHHAFGDLKDSKILEDNAKFKQFVGGQFATIEYYLKRRITRLPKNSELAGAANTRYMLDRLQKYDDIADGKDTLQAWKELEANVTGNSMGSLQRTEQFSRDTGTTDDAKKIILPNDNKGSWLEQLYRLSPQIAAQRKQDEGITGNRWIDNFGNRRQNCRRFRRRSNFRRRLLFPKVPSRQSGAV